MPSASESKPSTPKRFSHKKINIFNKSKILQHDTNTHSQNQNNSNENKEKPLTKNQNSKRYNSFEFFKMLFLLNHIPIFKLSKNLIRPTELKKKTLVLDLDETLIHANMNFSHNKKPDHVVEVIFEKSSCLYYIYKRPHVDAFLRTVII